MKHLDEAILKQRLLELQKLALTYNDASSDALEEAAKLLEGVTKKEGLEATSNLLEELKLDTAFLRDLIEVLY